jgi:hypothetical protein
LPRSWKSFLIKNKSSGFRVIEPNSNKPAPVRPQITAAVRCQKFNRLGTAGSQSRNCDRPRGSFPNTFLANNLPFAFRSFFSGDSCGVSKTVVFTCGLVADFKFIISLKPTFRTLTVTKGFLLNIFSTVRVKNTLFACIVILFTYPK